MSNNKSFPVSRALPLCIPVVSMCGSVLLFIKAFVSHHGFAKRFSHLSNLTILIKSSYSYYWLDFGVADKLKINASVAVSMSAMFRKQSFRSKFLSFSDMFLFLFRF